MIDFSELYNAYKDEWVALDLNEHIVIGHDMHELWQRAKEITPKPVIKHVAL